MKLSPANRALALSPLAIALCTLGCGAKLLGVAGSIAVTPTQLDFAQTTVGVSQRITVSVANQGSAALSIASIKVATDPNNELKVASLLATDCTGAVRSGSTSLSPGECAQFTAIWTPNAVHSASGTIEVDSNDTQNPVVTLPVSGDVVIESCNPVCTASQTCCGTTCYDTQTDPAHCGGCNACDSGQTCNAGVCTTPVVQNGCDALTAPCGGSNKCCNHACVDVSASGGVCPCTGDGSTSNFAVGTIIIPMDVCWQRGIDVHSTPAYCSRNAKTTSDDAPLKAYGLVFFLIRHNVTVYVAIDPTKTAIAAPDMTLVSLDGTPPVLNYDWASGTAKAFTADPTQNTVQYRGGPFLIDASQHDRVMALLKSDPDFQQFRDAKSITLHVANEGFQSVVAKSINAVPSRIALLSPTGDDSSYQILVRYLASAGLNFAGAGGTPSAPGQIYDQLQESDFLPDYDHSALKANGYKLLWAPHWDGASTPANTTAQLATIGAYVDNGGDVFAECAAIGTIEGLASHGSTGGGSPSTHFMTTHGVTKNSLSSRNGQTLTGPFNYSGLASVFAQRGDFPFAGFNGAIFDFHPTSSSAYQPDVTRYVAETVSGTETDLFTSRDQHAAGKGTVVYLAGHDYSYGGDYASNAGITAGSRLVLNTLFSLGTNNVCVGN